jgi:hypothetical protein
MFSSLEPAATSVAPTKRHKKDQAQPSRAPPLLLQPARPVQIL